MIVIRTAREADLGHLPGIERAAATRFVERDLEVGVLADVTSVEAFAEAQRAGHLFVAASGSGPVGFAYCEVLGADLLLGELDVLPDYGRRGIGRALVDKVLAHARESCFEGVVLTTFREVPWNAPFYRSMGFEVVGSADWNEALRDLVQYESDCGLRAESRVVMRFVIA